MNHAIYRLSLDMHCDSSGVTLHTKRRDTARQIHITLTDGGVPYTIAETCFAMLTARTPTGLLAPVECVIEGDTILCPIGSALTAEAGEVACELRLYDRSEGENSMLITSPRFTLWVSQPVQDGSEEEELLQPQGNALDALVSRGLTVTGEAEAALKALQEAHQSGAFDGKDGIDGKDGVDGKDGADGIDGYTPVKGVDYFTPAEKEEFQKALEDLTAENFAATAILCRAYGEGSLTLSDGASYPLQGLKLSGLGQGGETLRLYCPEQCETTVLRQPADVTAPVGTQVQFSVLVGGNDLNYKWEYSTNGGISWYTSSFPGNDTEQMTVAVTAARNGFKYRCKVTDAEGTEATSQAALLTVGDALSYSAPFWNEAAAMLTAQLPPEGETVSPDLTGLRCHKGAFTLVNDLGAAMELEYVADPKTYIDAKFAALAAAML